VGLEQGRVEDVSVDEVNRFPEGLVVEEFFFSRSASVTAPPI
jgi:hypothetical protein